jgi:DNA-binding transcriptional regulator YiaG
MSLPVTFAERNAERNRALAEVRSLLQEAAAELRTCRRSLGASQVGAARLLGVPYGTYKHWEQAEGTPLDAAAVLIKVARAHGLEVTSTP